MKRNRPGVGGQVTRRAPPVWSRTAPDGPSIERHASPAKGYGVFPTTSTRASVSDACARSRARIRDLQARDWDLHRFPLGAMVYSGRASRAETCTPPLRCEQAAYDAGPPSLLQAVGEESTRDRVSNTQLTLPDSRGGPADLRAARPLRGRAWTGHRRLHPGAARRPASRWQSAGRRYESELCGTP